MKNILVILTLFLSAILNAQIPGKLLSSAKIYEPASGLALVDTPKVFTIAGSYFNTNGFAGYKLILDSDQTFQIIGFDCVSRSKTDSGTWNIQKENILLIKSNNQTKTYDIIKLGSYYLLVPQTKRKKFISDFLAAKEKLKNARPFTVAGKLITVDDMIGFILSEKYFAKDFLGFAGA